MKPCGTDQGLRVVSLLCPQQIKTLNSIDLNLFVVWMNRVHNKTFITFIGEREISLANSCDEEFANATQEI